MAIVLCAVRVGAQGSISGTVYDSLRMRSPLANATVVLIEPSRYATTDDRGRFTFDSVAPGKYTVGFTHAVLDSLDLQGPIVAVMVVAGQRAKVALSTPSSATMYARLCPGVHDTATGMVIGRVRNVDDQSALSGADVRTDWTEYTLVGTHVGSARMRAATKSNPGGIYLLCGVPTRVPLEVESEMSGFVVGPTPLLMDGRIFTRVDFAISLKDSAARVAPATVTAAVLAAGTAAGTAAAAHADSGAAAVHVHGTATLRGVVLSSDGHPLRDAVVTVMGTDRTGRTDAAGAFRIEEIPAGSRTIEVRSIGMLPTTFSVDLASRAVHDTTVAVTQRAQELKAVSVVGKAQSLSLMENDGFAERKAHGLGSFLTDKDLVKHNYTNLVAVLGTVRGMHIAYGTKGYPLPQMLGIMNLKQDFCVPNFWVDGAPFHVASSGPGGQAPFTDLSDMIRPEMIKGIEVYTNPGEVPAQYDKFSSTGCGSIVIWTR